MLFLLLINPAVRKEKKAKPNFVQLCPYCQHTKSWRKKCINGNIKNTYCEGDHCIHFFSTVFIVLFLINIYFPFDSDHSKETMPKGPRRLLPSFNKLVKGAWELQAPSPLYLPAQFSKQSTSLSRFCSVIKPIFFHLWDRSDYIGWFCFLQQSNFLHDQQ